MKVARTVALVMLAGCAGDVSLGNVGPSAEPLCGEGYTLRLPVRIDGSVVAEPLQDFPLLVEIPVERLQGATLGTRGEGLSFRDASCQPLDHTVDFWGPDGGAVWVRLPQLEPRQDQMIFLFAGQAEPVDASQPNRVFVAPFVAVYHLQEEGMMLADSSELRGRGTSLASMPAEGKIGRGRSFDENGARIVIDDEGFPQGSAARTVCTWAWSTSDGDLTSSPIFSQSEFSMGQFATRLSCSGPDRAGLVWPTGVFPSGERFWRYACCRYDGSSMTVFADGIPVARGEESTWRTEPGVAAIGRGSGGSWNGRLDEVRFSAEARSDAWLTAEHDSMTGRLVTLGEATEL